MATVDSTSTVAKIKAAYLDNCSYEEDASVSKARAFVTVCLAMLARGITRWRDGDQEMHFDPSTLRELADKARSYANANDTTLTNRQGQTTRLSFRNFRS